MNIYEKLAAMSNQQIDAVWRELADYDPSEDSNWYDSTENISMNDWMQAVYSEMDRRGLSHLALGIERTLAAMQSDED